MLDGYFAKDWERAADLNDRNEQQAASFELTKLVMLYRERIATRASSPPPAKWDGVYEAAAK